MTEYVATASGVVKHVVERWEPNPFGPEPITRCGRWLNPASTDFREVTEHDPICTRCKR